MTDTPDFQGKLGLADFLSDLRAELEESTSRAQDSTLKLEIGEMTLALDVSVTLAKRAEGSVGVKAKFWVFASADAGIQGGVSSERVGTQHLTSTLRPRIEQTWTDGSGTVHTDRHSVDVSGEVHAREENPVNERGHESPRTISAG